MILMNTQSLLNLPSAKSVDRRDVRVLLLYLDRALMACENRSQNEFLKVIRVLIQNLKAEGNPKLAHLLLQTYDYLITAFLQQRFNEVTSVLRQLKQGWADLLNG